MIPTTRMTEETKSTYKKKVDGQRRPGMTKTNEDRSKRDIKIKVTVAKNVERPPGSDNT